MTIGSWEPGTSKALLTLDQLVEALAYTAPETFPKDVPSSLLVLKPYVKTAQIEWNTVLSEACDDQLKDLCRFFTLAEANWADWFGGDKNPVIWICKELKKRGQFPDKELTQWIKANSENRFLPYGNVFG